MLERLVGASITHRFFMAGLLLALFVAGGVALKTLPIDAMPDVSTVQVSVLTEAPGLTPTEVEQMVTAPVERVLNGVPHLDQLRSVSRPGLSAVTVVFKDGTNVWFARQLIVERLREVQPDLPSFVAPPQLAPVSTGLGEIYTFVLTSASQTPMQLRTLLDWELIPELRAVPGVIEVNPMGGELKQYQIRADPGRLHSYGITLQQLEDALQQASATLGAGYVERGGESLLLRARGLLSSEQEVAQVVVKTGDNGTPILVGQLAEVTVGSALRYGVTTRDGEGEVVTGTVIMLLGSNSRDVITRVKAKVAELDRQLPPGVHLQPVYDRSEFVGRTLRTVTHNLLEGALVVLLVLALFLGTLRGAFAVVLGIPAAMCFALFGMHLLGVTGDLMSLGAIDFGFLVDGPIVMMEAAVAALAGKALKADEERLEATRTATQGVVRPVVFSVAIIMMVYLPLFSLQGVEGKMFRPMASVMACALLGAVVYSAVFYPGVSSLLLTRVGEGPRVWRWIAMRYGRLLPRVVRLRWPLLLGSLALLGVMTVLMGRQGANFLPRIGEGDLVLTIRRAPSIGLEEAKRLDLLAERALKRFPEVVTTLGMTGRAELAYDPVGNENTSILVHLIPEKQWTTGHSLDELAVAFKNAVERDAPGSFTSVSQPIEDRTNELLSGSRADVAIQLYGPDLDQLVHLAEQVGKVARGIRGAGDVRVERLLGMPNLSVTPDRQRLARFGVRVEDLLQTLGAARVGLQVGHIYEHERRFDLRLLVPAAASTPGAVAGLFVEAQGGTSVPLGELAQVAETEGPAQVRREGLVRTVRVEVNLRGRDLVSWVQEAQAAVGAQVSLPTGYRTEWGGQFQNFQRARQRLGLVVPLALAIIVGMLIWTFGSVRFALAVFALVPLALVGGMAGLVVRGMTFSLPAAVGFIALAGVAVLNGVVMTTEVRRRLEEKHPPGTAILEGARHSLRAVLTTASVAALGFLPMAISHGAGAEVQRPLATVVIFGVLGATVLMLVVFPGILWMALRAQDGAKPSG